MAEGLEAIKKKRRFLRKSLTDTLKSVDETLFTEGEDNYAGVQVLKDSLSNKWKDLQDLQTSLCIFLEDRDIDKECKDHHEYEMRVLDCMAKMTVYLKPKETSQPVSSSGVNKSSPSSTNVQVKLPKIELPTFDGDILTWQPLILSVAESIYYREYLFN